MRILLTCCLAAFLTVTFWLVLRLALRNRLQVLDRLQSVAQVTESAASTTNELDKPLSERLLMPLVNRISGRIRQLAPEHYLSKVELKLARAGKPSNLSAVEWVAWQLAAVLLGAVAGGLLSLAAPYTAPAWRRYGMVVVGIGCGVLAPSYYLSRKTLLRQKAIRKVLPDCIDLLSVSMEAGLGFDGALAKVTEKMDNVLSHELEKVLQETRLGKPRREVLREMAERTGVNELEAFISTVIQADKLGVPIGRVLRVQAAALREKRRQQAEEMAQKAPVKMLIPLVFFIFPTIFIVLLGPALISIMSNLK